MAENPLDDFTDEQLRLRRWRAIMTNQPLEAVYSNRISMEREMLDDIEDVPCCVATVWKPDCLRRTGRGQSGFEMHYSKEQCKRAATHDGRCWQHADKSLYATESNYFHKVKRRRALVPQECKE